MQLPSPLQKNRVNPQQSDEVASIERQVLIAICNGDSLLAGANRAIENLSTYAWQEPEHETVYQAIRSIAGVDRARLRDELPSQATRMGFPDVDWPQYFSPPHNQEAAGLDKLVSRLVSSAVPPT
ncbi:MAG: hypothetical protein WBQ34_10950 [Candidatus Acidiferrales bacterium]